MVTGYGERFGARNKLARLNNWPGGFWKIG
jgi:hypothetical protein